MTVVHTVKTHVAYNATEVPHSCLCHPWTMPRRVYPVQTVLCMASAQERCSPDCSHCLPAGEMFLPSPSPGRWSMHGQPAPPIAPGARRRHATGCRIDLPRNRPLPIKKRLTMCKHHQPPMFSVFSSRGSAGISHLASPGLLAADYTRLRRRRVFSIDGRPIG